MTPVEFRKKLNETINDALLDGDIFASDILGSLFVVYTNFRLSYEMEAVRKASGEQSGSVWG